MATHHQDLWLALGTELEETAEDMAHDRPPALRGAQEFMLWMHNPLTQAFFAFLGDQESNFKDAVTEMFIYGQVTDADPKPDKNPDVWRGRILTLRDLQRITLGQIAAFYREKAVADSEVSDDGRTRQPAG